MSPLCLGHCRQSDGTVKSNQSTAVFLGQAEQIDIGQSSWCKNPLRIEAAGIAQRNGIRPKGMFRNSHRGREPARNLRHRQTAGIAWLGHHANAAILRDGASRPAERPILRHPGVGRFVMHMRCVEERDQQVDIQQRNHASLDSSRIFCTSCGVITRSSPGRISNPLRIF